MMKVAKFPLAVALTMLAAFMGCASAPGPTHAVKPYWMPNQEKGRSLLAGRWYGSSSLREGGKREWLMERRIDGTFTVKFRVTDATGKPGDQVEAGYWGFSGGILYTITREILRGDRFHEVDTRNATFNDAYTFTEMTYNRLRYRSIDTEAEYAVERVSADFKL
jgi:hypothetical protein